MAGDTATVAMQYSYLPSWISFLVDKSKAQEAGVALFEGIHRAWSQLPADHRPKLYVYGESLGSFGGQKAFANLDDMRTRTSGAVLAGTPNFTELWQSLVDQRDAGSPEVLPVYQQVPRSGGLASRRTSVGHQPPGRTQGRVPSTRLGPDRLVVGGPAPAPTGLAARAARTRCAAGHELASMGDVLASDRRHGLLHRRPGRPRARLSEGVRGRLGCCSPAGRLDDGGHRQDPRGSWVATPPPSVRWTRAMLPWRWDATAGGDTGLSAALGQPVSREGSALASFRERTWRTTAPCRRSGREVLRRPQRVPLCAIRDCPESTGNPRAR